MFVSAGGPMQGKVAIITNGTSDKGRKLAESLAERGSHIVIHYNSDRQSAAAEQVRYSIQNAGHNSIAVKAELSDPAELEMLLEHVIDRFGRVDLMVSAS